MQTGHSKNTVSEAKKKKKKRHWTWESPDGEARNQTDFTLRGQSGIVTNCEVITKADIESDQRLVE